MKVFKDVLRRNARSFVIAAVIAAVNIAVFLLYDLKIEPMLYAFLLALFLLAVFTAADAYREAKRSKERMYILSSIENGRQELPAPETLAEEDYQEMICRLEDEIENRGAKYAAEEKDRTDYYTVWAHEIKTPIAVMKLRLSEDTEEHRDLLRELFRIESYTEMALAYIRLGSPDNDLLIREYPLDEIICGAVRKFAPLFIGKKIALRYEPADRRIVTDKKWFGLILEQLLSNALKYTPEGSVTIRLTGDTLEISDTGVGIAAEDLPRIFEKGYTGINGRLSDKSSGLGLYLAGKAAALIAVPLSVRSEEGKGSCFILDLSRDPS